MCIAHNTTHIASQLYINIWYLSVPQFFSRSCDYCLSSRRTQSRRIAIKRPSQSGYMLSQCVFLKLPVCVVLRGDQSRHSQPRVHFIYACVCHLPQKRQMRRRCSVCAQPELRDGSEKCTSRHRNGERGSLSDSISGRGGKGVRRAAQPPAPLDHY
jgi:hypothetical protein